MADYEIPELRDSNGKPVVFWKGAEKTFTVTVKNAAGTAQDISSWIDSNNQILCKAKASLDASSYVWELSSGTGEIAFADDGTDGQFTVTVSDTDTATAYDSIMIQFFRNDAAGDNSVPFRQGIWRSRIRQGLL